MGPFGRRSTRRSGRGERQRLQLDDLYAWQLLSPLIQGHPYLPVTGAAVRPICLAHILNDVVINRRRRVLEFGAGVSTVLLGRLIRQRDLHTRVLAVEHEPEWAEMIRRQVAGESLERAVEVLAVPLVEDGPRGPWYDEQAIAQACGPEPFDLVVVDGPPAWQPGDEQARYPALGFVLPLLAERCAVYLDDANREGERAILERWQQESDLEFEIVSGTLARAQRGAAFYTDPLAYYA